MCSNVEDGNDEILLMIKDDSNVVSQECRKCCAKASVVLRKKDAYCKQCFLLSVTHKFRACLGKFKVMRPGDKVLVAFSGNVNSTALIHLIRTGLQDTSHKKLMFEPFVVFIDESSILNVTDEVRKNIIETINGSLDEYNYPRYVVPLEMSLKSELELEDYLKGMNTNESKQQPAESDTKTLKQLFDNLTEVSARADLLSKLRHNLIVLVAKCLSCSKVFTAESADDLAVKLMTNISLGRGAQLPFDVGFSDDRDPGVKVIRPLRDLSKKELAFYNVFHELASVHIPSFSTKLDPHSSIQKLTESFLCELQDSFPSTLSTVFRVADKLTTPVTGTCLLCPLCHVALDTENVASASLNATHFSGLLSSLGPSKFDGNSLQTKQFPLDSSSCEDSGNSDERTCCGGTSCSTKKSKEELQKLLCYGCSLIFKSAEADKMPISLINQLRNSSQRVKMKKEIEDFLL